MRPGKFIVLEGVDGAGTTSQGKALVESLNASGHETIFTYEPSKGPIGLLLREILKGLHRTPRDQAVSGPTMALLFAADRQDHLLREIEPALNDDINVVCDRYLTSSLAYQIEDQDIQRVAKDPLPWIKTLAAGVRVPDLTMLLDVPIHVAAERRAAAGRTHERYDANEYQERVRKNYLFLSLDGVSIIDASVSFKDVQEEIWKIAIDLVDR